MSNIESLDKLCALLWDARQSYDAADTVRKDWGKKCDEYEKQIIDTLVEIGKTNWETEQCKISITHKSSVKVPKDLESKQKFFEYLREKGLFDELVSINSNTLNGYYKEQLEAEMEAGNTDWEMPGIGAPTITKGLQVRGK